jgi:hypothetical protein
MKDWDKWICDRNERQINRADHAVDFLVAVVIGVIGAMLLLHWLSS